MSFPIIEHPTYKVPLSIGEITYRPFLVKEQKILMMAHSADNVDNAVEAIKIIANNCIISPPVNVETLPLVDLTMLFINLRARSMGETMKVIYKCRNDFQDNTCGMLIESDIDLLSLKPSGGNVDSKIMLTDDIGVMMKYPSFNLLSLILKAPTLESEFVLVAGCIDYVFDTHGIHKTSEASPQEVQKFVTDLPDSLYAKLKKFIESAPTVKTTINEECVKCKYKHNITLEGLSDFFV